MTQLPEVEVLRKELDKEVVSKRFKDIWVSPAELVRRHGTIKDFAATLSERRINALSRRGVHLLFSLDDDLVLVIRPGSRARITKETATAEKGEHTRMVATFTTGGSMHYHDLDADGEMFVVPAAEVDDLEDFANQGMDPLIDTIPWPNLARQVTARAVKLKTLLMDPAFIVGLGDVYSDEILFEAGLGPERLTTTLSTQEIRRLHRAILEVLYEAVKQGGVDDPGEGADGFPAYRDVDFLKIYDREGQPDARSREPIVRRKVTNHHYSYFSPKTQT